MFKFVFSFFFLVLFILPKLEAKSICEQEKKYAEYCSRAIEVGEFKKFKSNPIYQSVLEHLTQEQGLEYFNEIYWKFPYLLKKMDAFRKNDEIGSPAIYNYPPIGLFSPTTLRYIKVAGDLNQYFGNIEKLRIVEIGGGYGGQCFILSQLTGFKHYTIIDLIECLPLVEKYLKTLHVDKTSFVSNQRLEDVAKADLLISNYAFSEISYDEQLNYLEKIIKHIPMGYLTLNFISDISWIDSINEKELIQFLKKNGADVKIIPEVPLTADNNVILIWKPSLQ